MSMFLVWSRWSYQDELGASFHMSPQMKCLKPLARFYNLASYDIQTELYDPTSPYISHNLTRQIHSMRWDEIFPIDQTLYIGMNWRNWMFTESLNIYIYYWYLTRKLKILYAGVYRCRIQIKKRFVGGGGASKVLSLVLRHLQFIVLDRSGWSTVWCTFHITPVVSTWTVGSSLIKIHLTVNVAV